MFEEHIVILSNKTYMYPLLPYFSFPIVVLVSRLQVPFKLSDLVVLFCQLLTRFLSLNCRLKLITKYQVDTILGNGVIFNATHLLNST